MLTSISDFLCQKVDSESLINTKERVVSVDKRKAVEGEGRVNDVARTDTDVMRDEGL